MIDKFVLAHKRARMRVGEDIWPTLPSERQEDEVGKELSRLGAEDVPRPIDAPRD